MKNFIAYLVGWPEQQRRAAALTLLVPTVVASILWLARPELVWRDGWYAFWKTGSNALVGALLVFLPVLLVWIVFPLIFLAFGRPMRFVAYPNESRLRRMMIIALSFFSVVVLCITVVPLSYYAVDSGAVTIIVVFITSGATVTGVKGTAEMIRNAKGNAASLLTKMHSFPVQLRPLGMDVINLDVGGLAPRLTCVHSAVATWSRLVDGSAPTADEWWQAVSGSATSPAWQRNLRGLAWAGVDSFRKGLSDLLRINHERFFFLTSTTRALSAILGSIKDVDCIVLTDFEHASEELVVNIRARHSPAIAIKKLEEADRILNGTFKHGFGERVATAAEGFQRPLFIISHVPYSCGIRMPIASMAETIRSRHPNGLILIDGAHAVGHIDVDLSTIDFDYYVFSGHKWLFGPAALGVVVLGRAPSSNETLRLSLESECFESLAIPGRSLGEAGATIALEPLIGCAEAVTRLQHVWPQVHQNLSILRAAFQAEASSRNEFRILTFTGLNDSDLAPGIVNVQAGHADFDFDALVRVKRILETQYRVIVRPLAHPPSLRVCIPYYLSKSDVLRATRAIGTSFGATSFGSRDA